MITFTQTIDENKLYTAYNNFVLEFQSDNALSAKYCDITFTGASIRLYPAPNGKFWVNLKSFISALINQNKFVDNVTPNIEVDDPNTLAYAWDGILMGKNVNITIVLSDDSTDSHTYGVTWLAAVQQIGEAINLQQEGIYVLSPFNGATNNTHYLKMWAGYPFDLPIYTYDVDITITNQSNSTDVSLTLPANVSRIFFSDGRTDVTIEDYLQLFTGYNKLALSFAYDVQYVELYKQPYKCGVYLKWLNAFGGYNYWLFENTYAIDREIKQIGELTSDPQNIELSLGDTYNIGNETKDTYTLVTEPLEENEAKIVNGIFDSPKVYLFTGTPFGQNDALNWIEVQLKTTNSRVKNFKERQNIIGLQIELPKRYTQIL